MKEETLPVIAASARKHGIPAGDIVHAYNHPVRVFDLDDGFTMLIGGNSVGDLLEVGVVQSLTGPVVVHAMRARTKYLRS